MRLRIRRRGEQHLIELGALLTLEGPLTIGCCRIREQSHRDDDQAELQHRRDERKASARLGSTKDHRFSSAASMT
jgi:hypothetical protein